MPRLDPITVREIFSDAVALPAAQRKRFLDRACGGDSGLRARVQSLLEALASDEQFLAAPTVGPHGGVESVGAGSCLVDETVGTALGPYKLLERIGEGGFGTVYLAEQYEPVRRTVAVKVIKLGMDTQQVIARFEAERQALAMMDHPHIARVLDAGATQTGRPYFVMELVKGLPITQYCDQHRVPLRERLALFIDVCHAVQHAHQKGIIHRDLKPSNVLVSRHDDKPVVKVIDFGIVKATGERLTERTVHTEWRQLIGTPTYMSPEQAGLSDLDIDTRSDIYSLGVLLYELLTGSTPFDADQLRRAGGDELRRIIREVDPPTPSTRVSEATKRLSDKATAGSSVAASSPSWLRGGVASSLVKTLRGDLDWIVMTCLEKDRSRRYETASALAADVRRHLAGDPVVAAPPSRWYRIAKILRRNRTAVVAATAFIVLIAAALVTTGALWRNAAHARNAESQQRARSEAVSAFLTEMLTAAAPAKAKGENLTVREALDKAAQRVDEGVIKDQPLVEAEIRSTIGSTYFSLSPVLWPKAGAQFRAAETLQARELGDEHPDTLRSRFHLARTLIKTDLAGAAALAKPTLETQHRVLGSDHIDTLRSMVLLGVIHVWSGRFHEGEPLLVDAIQRREKSLGKDHVDTAYFLNRLGETYIDNTYPEKAEPLHREALRIYARAFGDEHPDTMRSLEDLGASLHNQHRDEEAEEIYRRLLEPTKRIFGSESPATLGLENELAGSLMHQGKHAEAEPIFRATLAAQQRVLGPTDYDTIMTQRWFASSLAQQKRYVEAEKMLREALSAAREKYGPTDVGTSMRLKCALASVLANQEKDAEAEQVAREVINLQKTIRPRPWPEEVQQVSLALIEVLNRRGANDEAVKIEQELIEYWLLAARAPDANAHSLYMAAWRLLTPENEILRDPHGALQLALQLHDRSGGKNPRYLRTLAKAYSLTGDAGKAVELQKQALDLMTEDALQRPDAEARPTEYEAALENNLNKTSDDK